MIFLKTRIYIAIELMAIMEKRQVLVEEDEWISGIDHVVVAHYKHNVPVRAWRANVLSSFVNCEYRRSLGGNVI